MSEKSLTHEQHRTKEAQLVVPLDKPRTSDYDNTTITPTSGTAYTIASGKVLYIKQLLVTELSGTAGGRMWLEDLAGGHITPPIPVAANTMVSWDPRPWQCGPISGNVLYATSAGFYGEMLLLVQIDPQATE